MRLSLPHGVPEALSTGPLFALARGLKLRLAVEEGVAKRAIFTYFVKDRIVRNIVEEIAYSDVVKESGWWSQAFDQATNHCQSCPLSTT